MTHPNPQPGVPAPTDELPSARAVSRRRFILTSGALGASAIGPWIAPRPARAAAEVSAQKGHDLFM